MFVGLSTTVCMDQVLLCLHCIQNAANINNNEMESNILKPIRFVDFSHRNKVVELYKAGDPPGSQYMRESCALTLLPSRFSIRNILNSTDPFFICIRGYRRCTGNTVVTMWIRTVRCRQVP